jgi:hypothetical protein
LVKQVTPLVTASFALCVPVIVVVHAGAAEAASDIAVDVSPVATRSGKAARITQRRTLFVIVIPRGRACTALPRPPNDLNAKTC